MSCFFFFGWRKAAKCKRMINKARCRLKLLMSKRSSIVNHLRQDVALLIKNGHHQCALKRAEHLFKDETMMSAYQLLDNFCKFITINLSTIRKKREFPDDINEAISTLIYASARCGDLPELREIRKLFGERFGQSFASAAVDLLPGNLVNDQVKDKLSVYSVPDHVKYNLVNEIAQNHGLQPEILAIEYATELQWYQSNMLQELIRGDVTPSHCDSAQLISSSVVQESVNPTHFPSVVEENKRRSSSSESLPRISDDKIVYIDDIEEIHSPNAVETEGHNKTSFMVVTKSAPNGEKINTPSKKDVEFLLYYDKSRKSQSIPNNDKISSETRTFTRKQSQRKSSGNSTPMYEVFTYKDGMRPNEEVQQGKRHMLRAMTAPPERKREDRKRNMTRACSLPAEHLNHVHPRLPDYEDLEVKFMALKKEHLHHNNEKV